MVDKIEIESKNNFIILDKIKKEFIINNIKKEFNEDIFNKLLNIISLWKNKYINDKIIDGIIYNINIYTDEGKENIILKNDFPLNFYDFLNILGEL